MGRGKLVMAMWARRCRHRNFVLARVQLGCGTMITLIVVNTVLV